MSLYFKVFCSLECYNYAMKSAIKNHLNKTITITNGWMPRACLLF